MRAKYRQSVSRFAPRNVADRKRRGGTNGQATRSCITSLSQAAGKRITTIEAIGQTKEGKAVQDAWVANDVPQCGYCQSGQVMSAAALLAKVKRPTDAEIDEAMAGNVCRCGTYNRIRLAVRQASKVLK